MERRTKSGDCDGQRNGKDLENSMTGQNLNILGVSRSTGETSRRRVREML